MVKTRLAKVCSLLNQHRVRYLVIGAHAGILHGFVRTTKDVDIWIDRNLPNIEKTLSALSKLPFQIAKEITPEELSAKPITIIGDNPRVDLLTALANIQFKAAWTRRKTKKVEGVRIPHLCLDDLISSKDTDRLQDQADRENLLKLKKQ